MRLRSGTDRISGRWFLEGSKLKWLTEKEITYYQYREAFYLRKSETLPPVAGWLLKTARGLGFR
jgi:hypothetical protein